MLSPNVQNVPFLYSYKQETNIRQKFDLQGKFARKKEIPRVILICKIFTEVAEN